MCGVMQTWRSFKKEEEEEEEEEEELFSSLTSLFYLLKFRVRVESISYKSNTSTSMRAVSLNEDVYSKKIEQKQARMMMCVSECARIGYVFGI